MDEALEALKKIAACFDENGELCETDQDQLSVALESVDAAIAHLSRGQGTERE